MSQFKDKTQELIAKIKKLNSYAIDFKQEDDGFAYFRIPTEQANDFGMNLNDIIDLITEIENAKE